MRLRDLLVGAATAPRRSGRVGVGAQVHQFDEFETSHSEESSCPAKKVDEAVETIKGSLEKGFTFDRYLAGPRELLAPLDDHAGFRQLARQQDVILVDGPVLGAVTDRSARFWVRVAVGEKVTG